MNIIEKFTGAIDAVVDGAKNFLVKKLEPEVLEEITERVKEYQARTLKELPEECERVVKEQSSENAAAWAINRVLGDDTSELVDKIVELMRPGIDAAIDQLNLKATEIVMARVRDALDVDGDSSDEEEESKKPNKSREIIKSDSREITESDSREITESNPRETTESDSRGVEADSNSRDADEIPASSRGGLEEIKATTKSTKKTVKRAKNLKERLPKIEAKTREFAHPIFEKLQIEIQELVPPTIRLVLKKKFEESKEVEDSDKESDSDSDDDKDRNIFSGGKHKIKKWFKKASDDTKDAAIDTLINMVDDPIYKLIDEEVAELEESSITSAFASIRKNLEKFHLIKKDPPVKP